MNSNKVQINCNSCGFPIVADKKTELELCPECGFLNKKPIRESQSFPSDS